MTQHQTHASADASRVSTRHGKWSEQQTNLAFADLNRVLATIRDLPYQERAVAATAFIDMTVERLQRLGVS